MTHSTLQRLDTSVAVHSPRIPAQDESRVMTLAEAMTECECELAEQCIDRLLSDSAPNSVTSANESFSRIHTSGEVIERVLKQSAYASVRAIRARIERNVVVLQGKVPTYYLRQLALAAAMKHLPGTFIVDFIEVSYA